MIDIKTFELESMLGAADGTVPYKVLIVLQGYKTASEETYYFIKDAKRGAVPPLHLSLYCSVVFGLFENIWFASAVADSLRID